MSKKIKQFGQVVRKDCFVLFTTSVQFNILICNSLSQFNNRACKQKEQKVSRTYSRNENNQSIQQLQKALLLIKLERNTRSREWNKYSTMN